MPPSIDSQDSVTIHGPIDLDKSFRASHLLDPSRPKKTLDFGSDGVSCSIGTLGDIISLSIYHPEHGIVTMNPFEQFPGGEKFWDSSFVRGYRKKFLETFNSPGTGFGLKITDIIEHLSLEYMDGQWPRISYVSDGVDMTSSFFITGGQHPVMINTLTVENTQASAKAIEIDFGGTMSVNRASYGQLTEGGPIPIPNCVNRARYVDGLFSVQNPNLRAVFECALYHDNRLLPLAGTPVDSSDAISVHHLTKITLAPFQKTQVTALYRLRVYSNDTADSDALDPGLGYASPRKADLDFLAERAPKSVHKLVIMRAYDYILSCCCVPINERATCIVTDHIALPLGWHRDNYWQMKFLRTVKTHAYRLLTPSSARGCIAEIDRVLYGHLVWIFDHAELTTEGFWGRSYLANGKLKDRHVFQLDQQCYPVLELAEYLDYGALEQTEARNWGQVIDGILHQILARKAADKWVFQTSETPGDDPVSMQYHFSSNVLLWHTLRKLLPHVKSLGICTRIDQWVDKIHRDTLESFTTSHRGMPIFAYLCDLEGSFEIYHDANDLPSVFAPEWSFCSATDPRWRNLFEFAFSAENDRAYFPNGKYGGLGSVHTPHPWPLGDAQEMIYGHICGNKNNFRLAREKALRKMQWDGSFAEANHEDTGEVTSKHWFSWPGSVIGAALLERSD